ncbi:hypothetical protein C9374_014581 [Naegleria lovaniensis]|uniref:Peptidase M16C associated domain-containing protein n=1 Tax=Naegleria lovaniensis TaxID=51637 RepID=A0AA88H026_NAELO|nr:uncharacterized protein C9374_014581 [Naegleria lovaniensis]KAG2389181.1 hypothetical protein C9374_014581 [Naegleria lovaniensis]
MTSKGLMFFVTLIPIVIAVYLYRFQHTPDHKKNLNQTSSLSEYLQYHNSEWEIIKTNIQLTAPPSTIHHLRHKRTKLEWFHVDHPNDHNNFFSISFRTPPTDNTGLTHILEHLVLCGSKKYPVRDAFFSMLKRSLSTYMNAFTAADITSYPFGTQNQKDFYNLMQIYLDAVFNPLLRKLDFTQEGYRFEFQEHDQIQSNLTFKGVVYSEMQGVMGDANNYFAFELNRLLFDRFNNFTTNSTNPSHRYNSEFLKSLHSYSFNYGGKPENIIDLKYEDLVAYHKKYYSPNNALIFTYGSFSFISHLNFVKEQQLLDQFEDSMEVINVVQVKDSSQDHISSQQVQSLITQPNDIHYFYGPEESIIHNPEKQLKYAMTFFTQQPVNGFFEVFQMRMLDLLLLENPRGPLYQSLIESKLAPRFLSITGFEKTDLLRKQPTFVIGVSEIGESDVAIVEETINKTLTFVIKQGFRKEYVESILNRIEISNKRVSANYGSSLMMEIPPFWCNGDSHRLEEVIDSETNIKRLRHELTQSPTLFQDLIAKYLRTDLSLRVVMRPNKNQLNEFKEFEQGTLQQAQSTMSEIEKKQIVSHSVQLKEYQNTEKLKDIDAILPSLTLSDIDTSILYKLDPYIQQGQLMGVNVTTYEQETNGLVHLSINAELWNGENILLDNQLLDLLPFFTYCLTKMGTKELDKTELTERIDMFTGGITSNVFFSPKAIPSQNQTHIEKFGVNLYSEAVYEKVPIMLKLLLDIMTAPRFEDVKYLETLFEEYATSIGESLTQNGHEFSRSYSASVLNDYSLLTERLTGISHFMFIKEFKKLHQENLAQVLLDRMHSLLDSIYHNITVAVTCESSYLHELKQELTSFLKLLNNGQRSRAQPFTSTTSINHSLLSIASKSTEKKGTFIELNFPVNYVSISFATNTNYLNQDFASLSVFAAYLFPILHKEIREKEGAYGQKSNMFREQVFSFYTYRDPNTYKTIDIFRRALSNICQAHSLESISEKELFESKLSVLKKLDTPMEPHQRFSLHFLHHLTDDMRQQFRNNLLEVRVEDLLRVCRKFLLNVPEHLQSITIMGSRPKEGSLDNHFEFIAL